MIMLKLKVCINFVQYSGTFVQNARSLNNPVASTVNNSQGKRQRANTDTVGVTTATAPSLRTVVITRTASKKSVHQNDRVEGVRYDERRAIERNCKVIIVIPIFLPSFLSFHPSILLLSALATWQCFTN